ncbi:MAG: CDP-alcohol phosphatidyltransferase family protein [Gracilimonas sp.]|uniref:CDP-alcohol phosphatidyltransferase family protein n=1 Tax=Gracilimonas TaxID=649462 RepID=UPI001B140B2D|nr:CDP-alcohol phosphatidyltransferase family protein [Gracilimonas sp.]MBO6586073.1 CDP-alcohol phosphatidyltransferase family protein [Gracilimonas sp.]MBO6614730.1 CDP-alcohol phosphatidyltransferase family protein [Gracilimonas sp.]
MKNIPNILSTIRMVLAPIFLFMYIQDELIWRSLSIAVFATAAVTDYFDGKIARYYQLESDFGVFIDPLADKFLTFAGFFCLPFLDVSQFPWWAVILIVIRDVFITALRLYANRKKIPLKTRFTAKAKTMVQMLFLYTVLLLGVFKQADIEFADAAAQFFNSGVLYYVMMFVTALTVYSGAEYIWGNSQLFKTQNQSS